MTENREEEVEEREKEEEDREKRERKREREMEGVREDSNTKSLRCAHPPSRATYAHKYSGSHFTIRSMNWP